MHSPLKHLSFGKLTLREIQCFAFLTVYKYFNAEIDAQCVFYARALVNPAQFICYLIDTHSSLTR